MFLLGPNLMNFWGFAPPDHATGLSMTGSHNTWLLFLSIVIACLAGLVALLIVNRIITSTDRRARTQTGSCQRSCRVDSPTGAWAPLR